MCFRNAGLQCCLRNTLLWPFMPALQTPLGKALLFSSSVSLERFEFSATISAVLCISHHSTESNCNKHENYMKYSVMCSWLLFQVIWFIKALMFRFWERCASHTQPILPPLQFLGCTTISTSVSALFWDHKNGELKYKFSSNLWLRQPFRFKKTTDIRVSWRWL